MGAPCRRGNRGRSRRASRAPARCSRRGRRATRPSFPPDLRRRRSGRDPTSWRQPLPPFRRKGQRTGMDGEFATSGFSDALVILGAAGIVIPAFARFRITPIIGFILIGILVGPAGLGSMAATHPWLHYVTISNSHRIEPFAELGIVFLLFSIGLELSLRRLWSMRRLGFGVGAAELLVSAVIIGGWLHMIGQGLPGAIGLGLALALSSTAIVL